MAGWTEQDLARLERLDQKPRGRIVRGPNKTETAYGAYLQLLRLVPAVNERVDWYAFEALKVRIGVKCWYTPDYLVQYSDGHLELHDCKGTKREKYYAEDDAIVKARSVSAHFPLPVFFVWRLKNGEWQKVRM